MCLPNILSPVFMFAFIFHCRSFSLCWPLAFLIVSQPLWIFMFFFLQNSSLLFSITRSSSFSVIHVSINIKNNVEKDTTLLLFFLSKSPGGHAISSRCINLGCHTCWLNYLTLVRLWCGRMVGRAGGRCTVTWLPNFLGSVVYHIFLPMVLRCAREGSAINFSQAVSVLIPKLLTTASTPVHGFIDVIMLWLTKGDHNYETTIFIRWINLVSIFLRCADNKESPADVHGQPSKHIPGTATIFHEKGLRTL